MNVSADTHHAHAHEPQTYAHVPSGAAIDVSQIHVTDQSHPETQSTHILQMRCACSLRLGMCSAPLPEDGPSHTFDCRWICCGRQWSETYCRLSPEEVAARLAEEPDILTFFGHKKGHISTARQLRYFVCEKGELRYYVSKLNVAPYGKDLKGLVPSHWINVFADVT